MKVVILAGGFGTRISEESDLKPKPMIEIGGRPILWHLMKLYSAYGLRDFLICAGYRSEYIKRYFADYFLVNSDISVNLSDGKVTYIDRPSEDWKVTVIDTGLNTMTGGRLKRIMPLLGDSPFCMTYGDGVADIDLSELVAFHAKHGKKATVTAVPSPGRFGILEMGQDSRVDAFREKPVNEAGWINGGFFVLDPSIIDYIDDDTTTWERGPMERLASDGELMAFRHNAFWQPMDMLRDKRELERLWDTGEAPWKRD